MKKTPTNKYNKILGIVKEALTIIAVEIDYILEEQELTQLSELRLNEIKRQSERIAKVILEEKIRENEK